MLVLTRTIGQVITLGNPEDTDLPIEITLVSVSGGDVRLGITAPRSVTVDRAEVAAAKASANSKLSAIASPVSLPSDPCPACRP